MILILASKSPRRQALIKLLELPYTIQTVEVDELSVSDPDPAQDAIVTALLKSRAVSAERTHGLIIGSDTNVAIDDVVLGKPRDSAEVRQMLTFLRNRTHQVHTGIAIVDAQSGRELTNVSTNDVQMRNYSDAEIEAYIASGDPFDKAGAYAIQHEGFHPVAELSGCYAGVMGLSICLLSEMLSEFEVTIPTAVAKHCRCFHDDAAVAFEQLSQQN